MGSLRKAVKEKSQPKGQNPAGFLYLKGSSAFSRFGACDLLRMLSSLFYLTMPFSRSLVLMKRIVCSRMYCLVCRWSFSSPFSIWVWSRFLGRAVWIVYRPGPWRACVGRSRVWRVCRSFLLWVWYPNLPGAYRQTPRPSSVETYAR